ncbi:MAG: OsmC family protein [Candidatus Limnocylindrales bacterium]
MTTRTATVTLDGDGLRFQAVAGSGHTLVIDDSTGGAGFRPAELVPVALAGCTAMDVISILRKKRQSVTAYEVRTEGTQRDGRQPAIYTRIDVLHVVDGPAELDIAAVRRAIELSATKYCAVSATLATGMTEVRHAYLVRRPGLPDERAEVIVEGPRATG